MAFDYVVVSRSVADGEFKASPGPLRFLRVAESQVDYSPADSISVDDWSKEVVGLADGDENPNSISPAGDVLIFVHGYDNDRPIVLRRLRQLRADLAAEGWKGVVVAFDWPSDNQVLNYLEDRSDGAAVALQLVDRGLKLVRTAQARGCKTNIHLLGHSTGVYVIMEAFAQAEKRGEYFKSDWRLGQVAFIGGDVARSSLSADESWSEPMFRRIMRLTNYSNGYDAVLAVSNAKRLGVSPRAGRAGLPPDAHPKAVNVDCSTYFSTLDSHTATYCGNWTHSWHIGDRVFARDLAMTLEGAIDRESIPTRRWIDNALSLQDAPRPAGMASWNIKDAARRGRRA